MFGFTRRAPRTPNAQAAYEVLEKMREGVSPGFPPLPSEPVFATPTPVVGVLVGPEPDCSGTMRREGLLLVGLLPRLGVRLDDALTRKQRSEVNAALFRAGFPTLGTSRTIGSYLRAQP